MAKITVTARWDGVERTAPLTPAIKMAFERQYNVAWNNAFSDVRTTRDEWDLWVGWEAMRRAGHAPPPFEQWVERLEDDISVNFTKPPVVGQGPLSPAPTTELPPPSQS